MTDCNASGAFDDATTCHAGCDGRAQVSVLFEKAGRMPGQMVGKSEYLHAVHVQGPIRSDGPDRAG
jgi:hypothetical protein